MSTPNWGNIFRKAPVVNIPASTAGGQLQPPAGGTKIPHAAQHSQKKKKNALVMLKKYLESNIQKLRKKWTRKQKEVQWELTELRGENEEKDRIMSETKTK